MINTDELANTYNSKEANSKSCQLSRKMLRLRNRLTQQFNHQSMPICNATTSNQTKSPKTKKKKSKNNQMAYRYYYLILLLVISIINIQSVCCTARQQPPKILNNQHSSQKLKRNTSPQSAIQETKLSLSERNNITESKETATKFDDDQQDEFYLEGLAIKGVSSEFINHQHSVLKSSSDKENKTSKSISHKAEKSISNKRDDDQLITAGDSSTSKYLSHLGAARFRYKPQVYKTLDLSSYGPATGSEGSSSSYSSPGEGQVEMMKFKAGEVGAHDDDGFISYNGRYSGSVNEQQYNWNQVDSSTGVRHDLKYFDRNNLMLSTHLTQPQTKFKTLYDRQNMDDNQHQTKLSDLSALTKKQNPELKHHRRHYSSTNKHNDASYDELANDSKNRKSATKNKSNNTYSRLQVNQPTILAKDVSVRSDVLLIQNNNNNNSTIDGLERRNLSGSLELPLLSDADADGDGQASLNLLNLPKIHPQVSRRNEEQQVVYSVPRINSKRIPTFASRLFIDLEDAPASLAIAQPPDEHNTVPASSQQVSYQLMSNDIHHTGDDEQPLVVTKLEDERPLLLNSQQFESYTNINNDSSALKYESTFDYDEPLRNQSQAHLDLNNQKEPSQRYNEVTPFEGLSPLSTHIIPPVRAFKKDVEADNIGKNLLRTSSTSSEIRVLEPNSTRLIINNRGLIMAAKKGSGRPYNASALFTNHINHSLSPVRVTPATAVPSIADSRPSFLQKAPTISGVIWRNQSRPTEAPPAYELIGENPPFLVVPHHTTRLQSNKTNFTGYGMLANPFDNGQSNNSSDFTTVRPTITTTSTSLPNTDTPQLSIFSLDGRRQSVSLPNTSQPSFHHNPPYKQQLHATQLDMASTQQIVADYDQKATNSTNRPQKHRQQPASNIHAKEPPITRAPASNNKSPPSNTTQQASVTNYDPPFELNSPLSNQLNSFTSSHNSQNSIGNSSSNESGMNNNLNSPNTNKYPQHNNNHKIMNKLQHMIIGKILKNQALNNHSNQIVSPTNSPTLSNSDNYYTPASLISSTVANNVASLIAHKLNSIFVKPVTSSSGMSGSYHSSSSNGLGLGSLFGYRVGFHPNSPTKAKKPINPFMTVTHSSPVNRRTAGVGSLLISGFIYGLSVLPALMALTGINPFNAEDSMPASSNLVANRQADPPVKKGPQPNVNTRAPYVPATHGNIRDAYAYLVPVIPTVSNVLDDEFFPESEAQHSDLKSLYSPPPTIIDPSESIQIYDHQHPSQATLDEFTSDRPMDIFHPPFSAQLPVNHRPSARYKSRLYYPQPHPPVATDVWSHNTHPEDHMMHESNQFIWQTGPQKSILNSATKARRDLLVASKYKRLPSYAKELAAHKSSAKSFVSNSTKPNTGRSYPVGYTLNYKPAQNAIDTSTMSSPLPSLWSNHPAQRNQRLIEFQDVDDVTSGSMRNQWKPIAHTKERVKYNLNQAFRRSSETNKNYANRIIKSHIYQKHHRYGNKFNYPYFNDQ